MAMSASNGMLYSFTLKCPDHTNGRGFFDVSVFQGSNEQPLKASTGDWMMLWGFVSSRTKFEATSKDDRDQWRTVLKGSVSSIINLTLLVHQGSDYLQSVGGGHNKINYNRNSGRDSSNSTEFSNNDRRFRNNKESYSKANDSQLNNNDRTNGDLEDLASILSDVESI